MKDWKSSSFQIKGIVAHRQFTYCIKGYHEENWLVGRKRQCQKETRKNVIEGTEYSVGKITRSPLHVIPEMLLEAWPAGEHTTQGDLLILFNADSWMVQTVKAMC